jgi:sterol desaturase/sphingolipid hydroxylase (fatty acid hydroxylase superfamily)
MPACSDGPVTISARFLAWCTFAAAVVFALVVRGPSLLIGIPLLFLLFVPLEKMFALRKQRVFRPGMLTDLTHILVNNVFSTIGAIVLAVIFALPLIWVRGFDLVGALPTSAAIALAVVLVTVGNYWGHRLTHRVPFLWRFHAVHHSIEQMDWAASGRLHPLDQSFTQAVTIAPLLILGYSAGVFGGVAAFITLLALFQHANVRLRFPGVRWVINTPEWHHWHHSTDQAARDKNFGLPLVDKLFGTAYLPKGKRPSGFGTSDPVPPVGYLRHLAYPFTRPARVGASA